MKRKSSAVHLHNRSAALSEAGTSKKTSPADPLGANGARATGKHLLGCVCAFKCQWRRVVNDKSSVKQNFKLR